MLDPKTQLGMIVRQPETLRGKPALSKSVRRHRVSVANERIKLTATFINSIAIAFMVLGVVRPYLGMQDHRPDLAASINPLIIGLILHVIARLVLGRLKRDVE